MRSLVSPRRWPLRRRLVVGTAALVLVTLLLSAAATVLSLRASLYERLDEDVRMGLRLAAGPEGGGPAGEGSNAGEPGLGAPAPGGQDAGAQDPGARDPATADPGISDPGSAEDDAPRQRVDTLEVVFGADGSTLSSAYVGRDGRTVSLTASQLEAVSRAVEEGGAPTTVALGGALGSFRVAAQEENGETVVSGLSMRDVSATIGSLTGILAVVVGLALLLAVTGIAWLVTAALRPLRRIADTAERVSQRPLEAGAVTMPERAGLAEDPRTEVGRVGAALDTLLNHVEAALTSRQESEDRLRAFIADASHELRTPLASIRGYAQLAQSEDAEMTAIQSRSFDRIESEAERMGALVEDLLLLARLDAGQALQRDTVDVTLLAIETADDAHAAHPEHEWAVEVDEPIEIVGDGSRLRQVLINLLGNAAVHTPAGTRVTTSVKREADRVRIVVADDGPGIPPELLPRLFDRFARGDLARNRATGSTGLGLSIAAAIVKAHGGTISAESDGSGASFAVELPVGA